MSPDFDKEFWEDHWRPGSSMGTNPPNPYLELLSDLTPGTALDAGCGAGAEAMWLADRGWRVTAADISAEALGMASRRAAAAGVEGIEWLEADLGAWSPPSPYDLVTTHYAHPAMPQLDFYQRLSGWVAPGGTLLVVAHLEPAGDRHGHGHAPGATATVEAVVARLAGWEVVTAEEATRVVADHTLHDAVVRAVRPRRRAG